MQQLIIGPGIDERSRRRGRKAIAAVESKCSTL